AQDDGEQEGIRQPPIDHADAAVGEFLEHRLTLLNLGARRTALLFSRPAVLYAAGPSVLIL
ncbi:MAG: hypothetical protein KH136_07315, partial [Oscillibacter sp.]|nr:hypothetical protein [Oscillibacter sp.]